MSATDTMIGMNKPELKITTIPGIAIIFVCLERQKFNFESTSLGKAYWFKIDRLLKPCRKTELGKGHSGLSVEERLSWVARPISVCCLSLLGFLCPTRLHLHSPIILGWKLTSKHQTGQAEEQKEGNFFSCPFPLLTNSLLFHWFFSFFFHLYQKDKGILSQIHFLGFKIIMEEENCETHKAFVDEALSLPLIRFGLKCPPPNAHPFSLLLPISLLWIAEEYEPHPVCLHATSYL